MEVKNIRNAQSAVNSAIEQRRLKDAFSAILPLLGELHDGDLLDEHHNLEFTYKSMLKYASQGIADPQRADIYKHVVIGLYGLSDMASEKLLTKYSGEVAYELKREQQSHLPITIGTELELFLKAIDDINLRALAEPQLASSADYEAALARFFNLVWLSDQWHDSEMAALTAFFDTPKVPWHAKALVASAMLMSLLRSWNLPLVTLLLNLAYHPDHRVRMRVLVNLVVVLHRHDARLPLYAEVVDRLKLLHDDAAIAEQLQAIMVQLIRTRETERISAKLQNEIIPEVMKMQSVIRQKLDLDNMVSDNPDDKNPEWSEILSDSPQLLGKLEEISKWQMEGADVFLNTFQMLKHFPFFYKIPNWFLPFYLDHPLVKSAISECGESLRDSVLFDNIAKSGFLCNSDKYSLFLGIPHMPPMQQQMLGQMFKAEMEQLSEIESDELMVNPGKRDLSVSNQYVQDLYRFFKIHPQKNQFSDVFGGRMDFYNKWFFSQLFAGTNAVRQLGEYLFGKNYHLEALEILEKLISSDVENVELLQKTAFCYQKLDNHTAALSFFLKADLLKPQNLWTIKKIARCYAELKDYKNALDYYLSAAKLDPDNLQTQAAVGHCLIETQQYGEALKYYFRVAYLDPSNSKVWRPIAWCSFVEGKLDQAENYYQKLLVNNRSSVDLMGLGHVKLCQGKTGEAMHNYRDSIRLNSGGFAAFLKSMEQEEYLLFSHGVEAADLPIFIDQIRYLLDE